MSLVPPACSLSFFVLAFLARVGLNSCTLFPLIYPTPFFFLSLHFLLKNILYSIDRHSSETIFFVFHGQEKNTWDSKSTNDFSFKQAGKLDLRRVSYIQ